MNESDENMTHAAEAEREPFWARKTLAEMSREEWEALCDGCGLCCLAKLEHEETGEVVHTRAICPYADLSSPAGARCTVYARRHETVPACVPLTIERIEAFHWLPQTCAYRLLHEGKPLPPWHPLVSGRRESVFEAGIAVHHLQPVPARAEVDLEALIVELREAIPQT